MEPEKEKPKGKQSMSNMRRIKDIVRNGLCCGSHIPSSENLFADANTAIDWANEKILLTPGEEEAYEQRRADRGYQRVLKFREEYMAKEDSTATKLATPKAIMSVSNFPTSSIIDLTNIHRPVCVPSDAVSVLSSCHSLDSSVSVSEVAQDSPKLASKCDADVLIDDTEAGFSTKLRPRPLLAPRNPPRVEALLYFTVEQPYRAGYVRHYTHPMHLALSNPTDRVASTQRLNSYLTHQPARFFSHFNGVKYQLGSKIVLNLPQLFSQPNAAVTKAWGPAPLRWTWVDAQEPEFAQVLVEILVELAKRNAKAGERTMMDLVVIVRQIGKSTNGFGPVAMDVRSLRDDDRSCAQTNHNLSPTMFWHGIGGKC